MAALDPHQPPPTDAPHRPRTRLPFVPYGLAPAVGLLLLFVFSLFPFASGAIEDVAERTANQALINAGAGWASASANGQWVTLYGAAPSRAAAAAAVEAVRTTRSRALFGEGYAITRLSERFTYTDNLSVAEIAAATQAAPVTPETATACEVSLANLLRDSSIQFATASSTIGDASNALLDSVARAAAACPGVLRIEGHTDNAGSDAYNLDLSTRRAEAVRRALTDRGMPASRLVVEGFGASRPLASNDTQAGRDQNRRIEFRVVRPQN